MRRLDDAYHRSPNPTRARAAAYWFEQANDAPDAWARLVAACFAFEGITGSGGDRVVQHTLAAIESVRALGDRRQTIQERVEQMYDARAAIVHRGNLDPDGLDTHERRARNLADYFVRRRLGLTPPDELFIVDDP